MRRAYIGPGLDLRQSFILARTWAGLQETVTLMAPSTGAVEASPWLERAGLPIGLTGHRRSRFRGRPAGIVIAWCLGLEDLLDLDCSSSADEAMPARSLESADAVSGVVVVRATGRLAPWATARHARHLGGEPLSPTPEASAAEKAAVAQLTGMAVLDHGLTDSRERAAAVQALAFLRDNGVLLSPEALCVEALRNGWPRRAGIDLAEIARGLNAGTRMRHDSRLSMAAMRTWFATDA